MGGLPRAPLHAAGARWAGAEGARARLPNKRLAEHLRQRAQGFHVSTFHSLCRDLCEKAGIDSRLPEGAEELQTFYEETAPQHLMEASARLSDERFDAVIVDEGQDFLDLW